jgi:hypothetical protein
MISGIAPPPSAQNTLSSIYHILSEKSNHSEEKEQTPHETASALKAIPYKARLTALHAICLLIFRHIAQKSLARRLRSRQDSAREQRSVALGLIATTKSACGISMQSVEKSDCASYAQALYGIAFPNILV